MLPTDRNGPSVAAISDITDDEFVEHLESRRAEAAWTLGDLSELEDRGPDVLREHPELSAALDAQAQRVRKRVALSLSDSRSAFWGDAAVASVPLVGDAGLTRKLRRWIAYNALKTAHRDDSEEQIIRPLDLRGGYHYDHVDGHHATLGSEQPTAPLGPDTPAESEAVVRAIERQTLALLIPAEDAADAAAVNLEFQRWLGDGHKRSRRNVWIMWASRRPSQLPRWWSRSSALAESAE